MELRASQLTKGMQLVMDGEFIIVERTEPVESGYIKIYLPHPWEAIIADPDEKFSVYNLYEMWQEYELQKAKKNI
jgi:hypothetical protein